MSDELNKITGIAEESVNTLGTVIVKLLDDSVEFHVLFNDFPFFFEGIIGRAYLRQGQAQLSLRHNSLVIISIPVTRIPSIDRESQAAREKLKEEIKPLSRTLKLKAYAQQLVPIDVVNQGLPEGYLPRVEAPNSIYIAEGLVTNTYACNTTEDELQLEIQPQEIIPFEYWVFPGVNSEDSETEEDGGHVDRIGKVINTLHAAHLNTQEKYLVLSWAKDFSDVFHINSKILSEIQKVQHRISTIDYIVIAEKQYRQPPEARELQPDKCDSWALK